MAYESNGSGWNQIQLGVRETKQLLDRGEYNLCMVKARQTLELMVGFLAGQSGIQGSDLVDAIDQLTEIRFITRISGEHYHAIRMLGNKAVHENYWDPNEAQRAYRLLLEEVRTFGNDYLPQASGGVSPQAYGNASAQSYGGMSSQTPGNMSSQPYGNASAQAYGGAPSHTRPSDGGVDLPLRRTGSHREGAREGRRERDVDMEPRARRSSRQEPPSRGSSSRSRSGGPSRPSSNHSRRRPSGAKKRRQGITPIQLIKLGVALIVLLLLILLAVRLVKGFSANKKEPSQSSPSQSIETVPETTAQPATLPPQTEPSTEAPAESQQAQTYKVTADVLNLRAEASQNANIKDRIPKDAEVEYVRKHDDSWAVVRFNGNEGYVSSQFITPSGGGAAARAATEAPATTAATATTAAPTTTAATTAAQ